MNITLAPTPFALLPLALPCNDPETVKAIALVVFDFDGVFTDNMVYVSQTGEEMVRCSRSDAYGLRLLDKIGVRYWVLSGEVNPVVAARCRKISIPCIHGVDDKITRLQQMADENNVTLKEIAYLGNDWNDAECLAAVGLSVVVNDAYPEAAKFARYITGRTGGNGAVRELCEWIYQAKTSQ